MRIRNGALRYSIAWPGSAALGCMDAEDAAATECVTGASADLIGACSKRNGLAGNACSQQARESAPAVALPAPDNDRRRGHRSKSICRDALERDWRDSDLRRCPLSRRCQARVGVRFRGKADNIYSFWAFALLTYSGHRSEFGSAATSLLDVL